MSEFNRTAEQSGTASEQGKAPGRELERQVEMFVHGINSKAEYRDLEKGRVGYRNARLSEERADIELDLVSAAEHAVAVGNSMVEMAIRGACPFGDEARLRVQSTQANRQARGRHAPRDIHGVNGNTTSLVPTGHIVHPVLSSRSASARYHEKPAMHIAVVQRASLSMTQAGGN